MTDDRYALIQRLLHWLIALLVIGVLIGGILIDQFASKDLPKGVYNQIYALHKSVGVVILALMICRVVARLIHGAPAPVASLEPWQRRASELVHFAFYALLIAQPILGLIGVWAYPAPVPILDALSIDNPLVKDRALSEQLLGIHAIVGKILIALALIHIGAAIMHLTKKDGVFRRMSLGKGTRDQGGGEG